MSESRADGHGDGRVDGHGDAGDKWIWCFICHRCYKEEDAIISDGERLCAYYPECDGLLWRDGWAWADILRRFKWIHTQLPDVPERDTVYLDALF